MGHYAEIVADEEAGKPKFTSELGQQIEDFGLNRDVERRGRLVEQQDTRLKDQGARDRYPLALSAG